jgi:pyruvate dehydrogenase E2 component (dihydrolipoamide acetyltransferase)
VRRLLVDEGAVVPVGKPIAIVGTADEKIAEPEAQKPETKPAEVEAHPDQLPTLAAAPLPTTVATIAVVPASAAAAVPTPTVNPASPALPGKASPLAKRMARESKVDLENVKGSGPGGRIVRRDIEAMLAGGGKPPTASARSAVRYTIPSTVPSSFTVEAHADEAVSQSRLRQTIARRMAESKATVPHFYVTHEYKMEALIDLRKQFNAIVPEEEKLSVNDFIVKAAALTLRQFPNLNASLSGTSVLRHGAINIGIAVSVEGGLLTVVCRDADQKPLRQVSAEVRSMAARVREGKVRPEEIEGSTFSISNLGMYEVENFLAIINPPEAAILAIGSAREVPVVENGVVKSGWRMKASLSVDHRVSDGAEGARFMQALGVYLEEPLRLML